jgi:hypothetical protein
MRPNLFSMLAAARCLVSSTHTPGSPQQEEERERRLDFVPEESVLQTGAIEVGSYSRRGKTAWDKQSCRACLDHRH